MNKSVQNKKLEILKSSKDNDNSENNNGSQESEQQ